jgi:ribosomal protein S27AE
MGSWKKPDPELLPVHRPFCPKCQKRMITTAVSDGPEGFEHRRFACLKCTVTEIKTLASDPIKSDALRWLSGELRRPD